MEAFFIINSIPPIKTTERNFVAIDGFNFTAMAWWLYDLLLVLG